MLEVTSISTAEIDTGAKGDDYAALGILEYWRFDETGERHGAKLAGDRLVDGDCQPIPIEEPDTDILQGHSTVLNLNPRWDHGRRGWYDPETGRHVPTYEDQRQRADAAEADLPAAEARLRELTERLQQ